MCNNLSIKALPEFIDNRLNFYIKDLIESNNNHKHLVLGKRPQVGDVVVQSNDYLNLTSNRIIKDAHSQAVQQQDQSVMMSGIFLQDTEEKPGFETQMAEYTGFSEALLSQSGWCANVGLLQTIAGPDIPVYVDFFAHMSLWEGARIAGSTCHPFMHNNASHLRKQIKRYGAGIILVDSIYSTIGTMAPLEALCDLAEEFNCCLVVDESHSLGIYGEHGQGLVAELQLTNRVDFVTVSLAKTFAYRAGIILGHQKISETLPFVSYPAIFSSTLLPYEITRLETTLEVIKQSDNEREYLAKIAQTLRDGLRNIGFSIRSESQVIALETKGERNTEVVRDFLEDNGIFGAVFCRPATGKNNNIIRFSLNAGLTMDDIDRLLSVCAAAYENEQFTFA